MTLPSFIVAGARKAGTTWLDVCLRAHPQVFMPSATKEVCFFDKHYDRGAEWYARYFADAPATAVVGEVTSSYFASPETPARLARDLPDATVVMLLRNPIDRAWSDYGHYWSKGDMGAGVGFADACGRFPGIVDEGFYGRLLSRWFEHVGRERVAVFISEDARPDPGAFLSRLFARVGIDPTIIPREATTRVNEARRPRARLVAAAAHRASRVLHGRGLHGLVTFAKRLRIDRLVMAPSGGGSPTGRTMDPADRERLRDFYRADVETLSKLVDVDLVRRWGFDGS